MNLREDVDLFLEERHRRGCGSWAMKAYKSHCTLFVAWLDGIGVRDTSQLDGQCVYDYLESLRTREQLRREGKLSPVTIHKRMKHLKTFLMWLSRRGEVSKEVLLSFPMPKARRRLPKALSPEEVRLLLSGQLSLRDRAALYLMLDSGLRLAEVAGLTVDDLDLLRGMVRVRHGKGDKERYALFGSGTADCVKGWLAVRNSQGSFVFVDKRGRHLTAGGVYKIVKRVAKSVGVKVYPHALRHTFATEFLDSGGAITDLQMLLGHEDLKTTMIYVNVALGRLRQRFGEYSLINRLVGGDREEQTR